MNRQQPENTMPEKLLPARLREQHNNWEIELKSAQQERDHLKNELAGLTEEVRELQRERESERRPS